MDNSVVALLLPLLVLSSAVPTVTIHARVPQQSPRYRLTLLPLDEANDINNWGQVVGGREVHEVLGQEGRRHRGGEGVNVPGYYKCVVPETIDAQGRVFGSIEEG